MVMVVGEVVMVVLVVVVVVAWQWLGKVLVR